jgi:DUF4097 and DUF4098 domain-containing protein YvlB
MVFGAGAAAAAALLLAMAAPAEAHRVEKKLTVEMRPVVAVKNDHGKISVRSWDKKEVQVTADHESPKVEVDVDQLGNRIDVVTHVLDRNITPAELKTDFEITVPEETELQIKNDAGTIIVERVSGDLTFETVLADVNLTEVAGLMVVKTLSGSLLCVRCAGRIEVNTISGSIRMIQPISSYVRAKSNSGSIFFDGDFRPGGSYVLNNSTGPIEVRFTDSDSFVLRASTVQGKVDRDAALRLSPDSHRGSSLLSGGAQDATRSLVGRYGTGHARVELTTFSGTISIRRRN